MRWALVVVVFVGSAAPAGCVDELDVLGPGSDAGRGPEDGGGRLDAGPPDGGDTDGGDTDGGNFDAAVGPQAPGRTLAAGNGHTCAIVGGTLWCWGDNDDGQLGTGDRTMQVSPQAVGGGTDWAQVVAGATHACASRTDGSVWCWGGNTDGQLGLGDTAQRSDPTKLDAAPAPWLLASSQGHVCLLAQDGSLHCWGQNGEGQMGLEDWPPIFVLEPTRTGDRNDWSAVAAGQGHTLGLRDGTLYGWGRNTASELGLGSDQPGQLRVPTFVSDGPFRDVSAGQSHSCAIDAVGDLYCWGDNSAGQLGTGDRSTHPAPTLVEGSGDWTEVSVDTFHGCGLRGPGTLWCWGRNVEGQLGTGDLMDRLVPARIGADDDWAAVDVGRFHSCAQRADGSVWCTGENVDGRLGTGDTERRREMTRADIIF